MPLKQGVKTKKEIFINYQLAENLFLVFCFDEKRNQGQKTRNLGEFVTQFVGIIVTIIFI